MYEDIGEQIAVLVSFDNGAVRPRVFRWRGRRYCVDSLDLAHQKKQGLEVLFFFAVTCAGNSYELSFSNRDLTWKLERVWRE